MEVAVAVVFGVAIAMAIPVPAPAPLVFCLLLDLFAPPTLAADLALASYLIPDFPSS